MRVFLITEVVLIIGLDMHAWREKLPEGLHPLCRAWVRSREVKLRTLGLREWEDILKGIRAEERTSDRR